MYDFNIGLFLSRFFICVRALQQAIQAIAVHQCIYSARTHILVQFSRRFYRCFCSIRIELVQFIDITIKHGSPYRTTAHSNFIIITLHHSIAFIDKTQIENDASSSVCICIILCRKLSPFPKRNKHWSAAIVLILSFVSFGNIYSRSISINIYPIISCK